MQGPSLSLLPILVALLATAAHAGPPPARQLRALDALVDEIAATEFSGSTDTDRRLAMSLLGSVHAVDAKVDAWDAPAPGRARLRAVAARVAFAEVLLAVPCPTAFSEPVCRIYQRSLAEYAEPMAAQAAATAAELGEDLRKPERKRLTSLSERASSASATAAARLGR